MSSPGIRTYLEPDLAREVARLARAQGRSESSVIAEAVRLKFAAGAEAVRQAASETQKRQLNRIEARLDKLLRDQAVVKECVFAFVRIWLEHNPPLEDELADSLAESAAARFERFLDLVAASLERGGSIASGAFPNDWAPEAGATHVTLEHGA
jgi:hypothetical protein